MENMNIRIENAVKKQRADLALHNHILDPGL